MSALWPTAVAVLGTLAGALVAGGIQGRLAATARREALTVARRTEALNAVTTLVAAIAAHRRAMWVREDLRLHDADPVRVEQARAASHDTRAAITAPLMLVTILLPQLAPLAERAVNATYALRSAPDPAALSALRQTALNHTNRLTNAAARAIADLDTRPGDPSAKKTRRAGAPNTHKSGETR